MKKFVFLAIIFVWSGTLMAGTLDNAILLYSEKSYDEASSLFLSVIDEKDISTDEKAKAYFYLGKIESANPYGDKDVALNHFTESDVFLEVPGDKLRAIIGNDPGKDPWKTLPRPLNDYLHILLRHPFPDFPVNDKATVSIKEAAQIIKGSTDVEIGYIHMPVLMRVKRTLKTIALLRSLSVPFPKHPRSL